MTWYEYFGELGGVGFHVRAVLMGSIHFANTFARFEEWQAYFENDGVLGRYVLQEREALESIGITEELFEWMHKKGLHREDAMQTEGNDPDLYLTFDVTPELIQMFQQDCEREIEATQQPCLF